jgi:hypothetical protein
MSSIKLQSFEDFAKANTVAKSAKLEEEQSAERDASANQFKNLLAEFGATTLKQLKEDERTKFFAALGASELSESLAIIEEGTRSQIGKIKKNGKIESVYMHYDGYPDNMLPIIKKGYKDGKAVDTLLKKGGGSGLAPKIEDINFYDDNTPNAIGNMKDTEKFVKDAANNGGAEFIYLYSEKDSMWYMVDIYDSYDLVPAFESVNTMIINEKFVPSKGNLRDAKKVAKVWEKFFTEYVALADKDMMLGCIKYLVAEALTDANFHRYRDPVSKKIGGKITTVMVEIDRLGGAQIPVSKKSIINMIDSTGSDIANAAGWSGIGIVEGTALFIDGWGYSKIAEAIVAEFNLIYANESVMNEGNAFLAARAKAIEEDAEEFEFNGKNFPVINNSVEVKETEEVTESKEEDEAEAILSDLLGERDMDELRGMSMEDALDTVGAYGHKGSKAKKIAQELVSMTNESEVTESKAKVKSLNEAKKDLKVGDTGIDYNDNVVEVIEIGKFDKVAKSFKKEMKADAEDYGYEKAAGDFYLTKNIQAEEGNVGDLAIYPVKYDMSNYWGLTAESVVNEAEVKSDEEFKEYAFAVLGKAFGDDFDEEKAQEVVDGLLSKHGEEYGAAIGALTSSLG